MRTEKGLEGEKCFRTSVMKLSELVPACRTQALLPHLLCTKAVAPQACSSFDRLVGGSRSEAWAAVSCESSLGLQSSQPPSLFWPSLKNTYTQASSVSSGLANLPELMQPLTSMASSSLQLL